MSVRGIVRIVVDADRVAVETAEAAVVVAGTAAAAVVVAEDVADAAAAAVDADDVNQYEFGKRRHAMCRLYHL